MKSCQDTDAQAFIRRLRKSYSLMGELRSVDKKERLRFFWNLYIFPDQAYMIENYPIKKSWQIPYFYLVYQLSRMKPFFGIVLRMRDR